MGARSSREASATKRCCCWYHSAKLASLSLKVSARVASSSRPGHVLLGTRWLKLREMLIFWAVLVMRRTADRTPHVINQPPTMANTSTKAPPRNNKDCKSLRDCSRACSERAVWIICRLPESLLASVYTRTCSPAYIIVLYMLPAFPSAETGCCKTRRAARSSQGMGLVPSPPTVG